MNSSNNSKKIMGGLLAVVLVIPAVAFALSLSVTISPTVDADVGNVSCEEDGKEQKGKNNFNQQDCELVDVL
jgi:hypothetical protein